MRDAIKKLVGNSTADHLGLAYDVLAPIIRSKDVNDPKQKDRVGKVANKARPDWMQKLADRAGTIRADHAYRTAYARWTAYLDGAGIESRILTLRSRMLIGHGNPSPTEVGLTVHRTYGVPYIPGSALKGLLSHYIDVVYGPTDPHAHDPLDESHPEPERAPFQGLMRDGDGVPCSLGAIHRFIFGSPPLERDEDPGDEGFSLGLRGSVDFLDALPVVPLKDDLRTVAPDVMTPHHSTYDRSGGKDGEPNDYDRPIPIGFLSAVASPALCFRVAVAGPKDWAIWTLDRVTEALDSWGVGGKTSSGYGRLWTASSGGGSTPEAGPTGSNAAE